MPAHDIVIAFGAGAGDAQTKTPAAVSAAFAAPAVTVSAGLADPTQLPVATCQTPQWGWLGGLSAGDSTTAPVSGVTTYRVTDATTPHAQDRCIVHYSARGPYISRPWKSGGKTYYTLSILMGPSTGVSDDQYYVDFCYTDGTFSDWRAHGSPMVGGDAENAMGFSLRSTDDPQTVITGADGDFRKWDVSSTAPTESTSGNWPWQSTESRLHMVSLQEGPWIVGEKYPKSDVYAWNEDTNASCTLTSTAEPDIGGILLDRQLAYPLAEVDSTTGNVLWRRWEVEDSCAISTRNSKYQSHSDISRGFGITANPNTSPAYTVWRWKSADKSETDLSTAGAILNVSGHFAGQWIMDPDGTAVSGSSKLWGLFSGFGDPSTDYPGLVDHSIVFIPYDHPTRDVRFLCHHDSLHYGNKNWYYNQPHATMSPDGRLVMWESDMNDPSTSPDRVDVFLAIVPTS